MWKKIKEFIRALISVTESTSPIKYRYGARIFVIVVLMAYFALSNPPNNNPAGHSTVCIFHNLTGYPCPACGTVRGLKYFFHFDFYNSLMMNPLAVIVALYMIVGLVWMTIDLMRNSDSFERLTKFKPHWSFILVVIILTAANWWWNIEKGL
jgi:hypothetical protein